MKIEITKLGDREHFTIKEVNGYDDMLAVSRLIEALRHFDDIWISFDAMKDPKKGDSEK